MKKNTLKTLIAYLNGENVDITEAKAELEAEWNKNEVKAQANRNLYAVAHDIVINTLSNKPMTITEIYEACAGALADTLPEGFSKSKVQYALLHYWNDEVEILDGGKSANQYKRRV